MHGSLSKLVAKLVFFVLDKCFTDMSSLGRTGVRFFHKLNAAIPADLLEKGQNRVIDASLTLIREKAKLKVYFEVCFENFYHVVVVIISLLSYVILCASNLI